MRGRLISLLRVCIWLSARGSGFGVTSRTLAICFPGRSLLSVTLSDYSMHPLVLFGSIYGSTEAIKCIQFYERFEQSLPKM